MGRRGLTWLGLAVAIGASPAHAETTLNALSGFQGWSEPAVRDWRHTNAEVASGAMDQGHRGHGRDHGSMPPPDKAAPGPKDAATSQPMDHQGMIHGGSPAKQAEKPAAEPAPSSVPKPASTRPDHGAHGSHPP